MATVSAQTPLPPPEEPEYAQRVVYDFPDIIPTWQNCAEDDRVKR
jgi:hypothetical protein